MAGIARIIITDDTTGRGAYRFRDAAKRQPFANDLYREIFSNLDCPLEPGYEEIRCQKDDIAAAYDRLLGVDVIFRFVNGMSATLQEKFLFTSFDTITVEYYDDDENNEEGDWFNLRSQYYFVGYDRENDNTLQDWVLLNWSAVQIATNQGRIKWDIRQNHLDGARANFKYTHISKITDRCIVAKQWHGEKSVNLSSFEAYLNEIHHAPYND
jgi:hypothetical protein